MLSKKEERGEGEGEGVGACGGRDGIGGGGGEWWEWGEFKFGWVVSVEGWGWVKYGAGQVWGQVRNWG